MKKIVFKKKDVGCSLPRRMSCFPPDFRMLFHRDVLCLVLCVLQCCLLAVTVVSETITEHGKF